MIYIFISSEKYTRGVSAVESILTLDRLRQNVAVKELETAHGQPLTMRKTCSVPNFSQVRQYLISSISIPFVTCLNVVAELLHFLLSMLKHNLLNYKKANLNTT